MYGDGVIKQSLHELKWDVDISLSFQMKPNVRHAKYTMEMDLRLLFGYTIACRVWKTLGYDLIWAWYEATTCEEVWTILVLQKDIFPPEFLEQ